VANTGGKWLVLLITLVPSFAAGVPAFVVASDPVLSDAGRNSIFQSAGSHSVLVPQVPAGDQPIQFIVNGVSNNQNLVITIGPRRHAAQAGRNAVADWRVTHHGSHFRPGRLPGSFVGCKNSLRTK